MPRVLNLTPHALHIYCGSATDPVVIPSDGDLRLKTAPDLRPTAHSPLHSIHYVRASDKVEATIAVIPAQVFCALDETSPGYKQLDGLTYDDAIIVSMPVAQWMANHLIPGGLVRCRILSPGTGPTSVVRFGDEQPERKGQIKGVRALEHHAGHI